MKLMSFVLLALLLVNPFSRSSAQVVLPNSKAYTNDFYMSSYTTQDGQRAGLNNLVVITYMIEFVEPKITANDFVFQPKVECLSGYSGGHGDREDYTCLGPYVQTGWHVSTGPITVAKATRTIADRKNKTVTKEEPFEIKAYFYPKSNVTRKDKSIPTELVAYLGGSLSKPNSFIEIGKLSQYPINFLASGYFTTEDKKAASIEVDLNDSFNVTKVAWHNEPQSILVDFDAHITVPVDALNKNEVFTLAECSVLAGKSCYLYQMLNEDAR